MKKTIEINGTAYAEALLEGKKDEMALYRDGVEIARTCGLYCLVTTDGTVKINDVREWAASLMVFHLAHRSTFESIK